MSSVSTKTLLCFLSSVISHDAIAEWGCCVDFVGHLDILPLILLEVICQIASRRSTNATVSTCLYILVDLEITSIDQNRVLD